MVEKTASAGTLASAPSLFHRWKPGVDFVCMTALYGIFLYPILGAWALLVSASVGAYIAHLSAQRQWLGARWRPLRLTLEGIAFMRKRGRPGETVLAWDDIERVKLLRLWGYFPLPIMRVILRRRQSFWTLERSRVRRYTFLWMTWRRRAFREALRRHVPATRVDSQVWSARMPGDHRRFRWAAGAALIALGLAFGAFSFGLPWKLQLSSLWMGTRMAALLTLLGVWLGALGRPRLLRGGAGLVFSLPPATWAVALVGTGSGVQRFLAWPAVLGVCTGLALLLVAMGLFLVLMPRRPPGWTAAPVYLAAILGFFVGWWGYGGIRPVRLPLRKMAILKTPWTPNGDAFMVGITEPLAFLREDTTPARIGVAWQRADGATMREVTFYPRYFNLFAVGQDAALISVREAGGDWSLMYVPKSGDVESLLTAGRIWPHRGTTSPNRRWVVLQAIWGETEEEYRAIWYRVDINRRLALPLSLPHPHEDVTNVAVNDTGALCWLNGKEAEARVGNSPSRSQPPPDPATFEEAGRPFSIWYDDPSDPAPAVELHAEEDVWLDHKVVDHMNRIYATRLVRSPEPHSEHVCLRLEGQRVTVEPATEHYDIEPFVIRFEKGEWIYPPEKKEGSPDGRFVIELEQGGLPFPCRLWITDTRTGRRRSVRHAVSGWDQHSFSPDGRWLLLQGYEFTRAPWVLNPVLGLSLSIDALVVDLEAAFPLP